MGIRLEITEQERDLLLQLIQEEQKRFIQGLDHADSRDYKSFLKDRIRTIEHLLDKVQKAS
jgi:hypothetical protein